MNWPVFWPGATRLRPSPWVISATSEAVAIHNRAIEVYERLVNGEGCRELANDLAICYMNTAASLWALGDNRAP